MSILWLGDLMDYIDVNILPKESPIVYYSKEWMSKSDFEGLSGEKGKLKKSYCILFYNTNLKKPDNSVDSKGGAWPTLYAINYQIFQNCEIINNMLDVARGPSMDWKSINDLYWLWKNERGFGFLSKCSKEQVYFLGEIKSHSQLSKRLFILKKGKLKPLSEQRVK